MNKYLLMIEDNSDDVELTLLALRKGGIQTEVVVLRDGVEALEYLVGNSPQYLAEARRLPDLILLDLKLPKVDGFEVLRSIRADRRARLVPVVILSTSNERADLMEAYDLGANSYVHKSVDFSRFNETIRALGLYWLQMNNPPPQEGDA